MGVEGQEKLRTSSVVVIGAGGLGCPASLYLAAAGVARLTIADSDKVDLTNLQRQILYRTESVGAQKVLAARRVLRAVNPDVEIVPLARRVSAPEMDELARGADIVLDCSDNFATRHVVNRACVAHRKPLVSGAAIRFDAQLMVFDLRRADAPCYACLFPEDAQVEEVQCSQLGVFAPLTGMVGSIQAMEALKLLIGTGESLSGRLLIVDAHGAEWRTIKVNKDPACRVCGEK
ncbi:MAG: ThiF family adenylyltransferase [Burkholderiales bacterium]